MGSGLISWINRGYLSCLEVSSQFLETFWEIDAVLLGFKNAFDKSLFFLEEVAFSADICAY